MKFKTKNTHTFLSGGRLPRTKRAQVERWNAKVAVCPQTNNTNAIRGNTATTHKKTDNRAALIFMPLSFGFNRHTGRCHRHCGSRGLSVVQKYTMSRSQMLTQRTRQTPQRQRSSAIVSEFILCLQAHLATPRSPTPQPPNPSSLLFGINLDEPSGVGT